MAEALAGLSYGFAAVLSAYPVE